VTSRSKSTPATPARFLGRKDSLGFLADRGGPTDCDAQGCLSLSTESGAPIFSHGRAFRAGRAQLHRNGSLIHLTFGEFRQLSIGLFFLFEALIQKPLVIAQAELTGQTGNHAVGSDLVMLNFLP
jgi:hypothetical protein